MANLFLDSLEISNFRTFQHLRIERLGRVNLIVGKNSVGKTALLEALWLYVHEGELLIIQDILLGRNEFSKQEYIFSYKDLNKPDLTEDFLNALNNSLFYGRNNNFESANPIKIGPIDKDAQILSLDTRWYAYEKFEDGTKIIDISDLKDVKKIVYRLPGMEVSFGGTTRFYTLDRQADEMWGKFSDQYFDNVFFSNYVSANGLNNDAISSLWRSIIFNPLEDEIVGALQIIAPQIERITLLDDPFLKHSRYPIVKIKGVEKPLPLRSLGDGLNRIFGIALALVRSKDGILLVDEIENGLHFTVQLGLWRLIFAVARRLNVQVFATTHSWDCIQAFQQAANEDPELGMLIRLDNINGEIVPVLVDEQRLAIITREQIEVR